MQFPLLLGHGKERARLLALGCPTDVPWALVAPHEAQALRNHSQTLQRLAERGGLSPFELMRVVEGRRPWPTEPDAQAVPRLLAWLKEKL